MLRKFPVSVKIYWCIFFGSKRDFHRQCWLETGVCTQQGFSFEYDAFSVAKMRKSIYFWSRQYFILKYECHGISTISLSDLRSLLLKINTISVATCNLRLSHFSILDKCHSFSEVRKTQLYRRLLYYIEVISGAFGACSLCQERSSFQSFTIDMTEILSVLIMFLQSCLKFSETREIEIPTEPLNGLWFQKQNSDDVIYQ